MSARSCSPVRDDFEIVGSHMLKARNGSRPDTGAMHGCAAAVPE